MRTYKGFGGNSIELDSKRVVLTTPYIQEACSMKNIRDVIFHAPDFVKNGCLTVVTENNVIPIYFAQQHATRFIEAFSIIEALARKNEEHDYPLLGKDGIHLGRLKCTNAGHVLLKDPGRMDLYVLPDAFRFEYALVDLGCTVWFSSIDSVVLAKATGDELINFSTETDYDNLTESHVSEASANAQILRIFYTENNEGNVLEFKGRRVKSLAKKIIASYLEYLHLHECDQVEQ